MSESLWNSPNKFKRDITYGANKKFQKYLTCLGIKEMPIKNIVRFHFTSSKITKTSIKQMTQMLVRIWKKETYIHYWWLYKLEQAWLISVWPLFTKLQINLLSELIMLFFSIFDKGFPCVCFKYVFLTLVHKEAAFAYGRAE